MKTISMSVAGKNYDISLEDEFAEHLESVMDKFYLQHRTQDVKSFLSFFVELVHENYLTQENLQELTKKIKDSV